jgi:hypothetical protein
LNYNWLFKIIFYHWSVYKQKRNHIYSIQKNYITNLIFLNSISNQKCSKKISLNCRANFSKLDCLETSRNLTRASWPELKETGWALTRDRLSCAVVHQRLISGEVMASSNLKERATAVREDVSVRTKKSMWKRNDKEEILETERERERERGMMVFKERFRLMLKRGMITNDGF